MNFVVTTSQSSETVALRMGSRKSGCDTLSEQCITIYVFSNSESTNDFAECLDLR